MGNININIIIYTQKNRCKLESTKRVISPKKNLRGS